MKNLIVCTLFLSLVLLVQSCGKDKDEFIVTGTTKVDLTDTVWEDESKLSTLAPITFPIETLAAQLTKAPTKDTCTAEIGRKIVTPDDVTVEIPANVCVNKSNQPCKGQLDVEILILRSKGELIGHDKPTISGGKILVSAWLRRGGRRNLRARTWR